MKIDEGRMTNYGPPPPDRSVNLMFLNGTITNKKVRLRSYICRRVKTRSYLGWVSSLNPTYNNDMPDIDFQQGSQPNKIWGKFHCLPLFGL